MLDSAPDRRSFIGYFASIGLGSSLLPGVLWAQVAAGAEITTQTIAAAEEIAGVTFTEEQRAAMVKDLADQRKQIDELHAVHLENAVPPAVQFSPLLPGMKVDRAGNLFAAGPGGLLVLAPDGAHLGTLMQGRLTANCAWGDDGSTLYMTGNDQLFRIRLTTRGARF